MKVHAIDCVRGMQLFLADDSVDAIVTDPPYELTAARPGGRSEATRGKVMRGFMGMQWDGSGVAFDVDTWRQALRVLKPGGHLLAFSGTRTYHRMVCAIEDAGFEIRDQIGWLYGSGFPKSLDVSKAIDKVRDDGQEIEHVRAWLEARRVEAGISRKEANERLGLASNGGGLMSSWTTNGTTRAVPQWEQWTALKEMLAFGDEMDAKVWRLNGRKGTPSEEYASRPDAGYTTCVGMREGWTDGAGWNGKASKGGEPVRDAARQWQGWGTALKPAWEPIVMARKPLKGTVAANVLVHGTGALNIDECRVPGEKPDTTRGASSKASSMVGTLGAQGRVHDDGLGRWPANVIHDGSDEVIAAFPQAPGQQGDLTGQSEGRKSRGIFGDMPPALEHAARQDVDKSAARFFYCAKASQKDRNDGCEHLARRSGTVPRANHHPTVKPTELMRYLCRLVTPKGGLVLDPFAGSGSTGKACKLESLQFIGFELSEEYATIANARIAAA